MTIRHAQVERRRLRVDWTRLGTVVAVIAGIGTLLFTGVATYYQALVARDQLEQSRDDTERDQQDQASRVSFWEALDGTKTGAWELHLMNRSPDPVPNLELIVYVYAKTVSEDPTVRYVSVDGLNMAPCTEVILTGQNLKYYAQNDLKSIDSAVGALIVFEDRNAVGWVRTRTRLYRGDEVEDELDKAPDPYVGHLVGKPRVKQMSECGGG
ncbi:hypothetical protein [Streptomyces sp. NBC_01602]|uniref:hypothetical protein n=1 Tax=Streptomyces sp. NBC_01602 TaxID=2975893 RepID=UPI003869A232